MKPITVGLATGLGALVLFAVLLAATDGVRLGTTRGWLFVTALSLAGVVLVVLLFSFAVDWLQRPVDWHDDAKEGEPLDDCRL